MPRSIPEKCRAAIGHQMRLLDSKLYGIDTEDKSTHKEGSIAYKCLKGIRVYPEDIIDFELRPYQKAYLARKQKHAILLWGRRAGKDVVAFIELVANAISSVGVYYYIVPTVTLGEAILLNPSYGIDRPIIDLLPKEVIERRSSNPFVIRLINGSVIAVVGTDLSKGMRIRGQDVKGAVMSEFAMMQSPEMVLHAFFPTVTLTKGYLTIVSTPKGKNYFYDMWCMSIDNPKWYRDRVAWPSYLTAEAMADIKEESCNSESMYRSEYECDFEAIQEDGVFTGQLMDRSVVTDMDRDDRLLTYVSFDLGVTDDTAIWFCQLQGHHFVMVDYYENRGLGFLSYLEKIKGCRYRIAQTFVPPDIQNKDFMLLSTRVDALRNALMYPLIIRTPSLVESVDRTRFMLTRRSVVFTASTATGLDRLKNYRYTRNAIGTFNPSDPNKHAADSFRYMMEGLRVYFGLDRMYA